MRFLWFSFILSLSLSLYIQTHTYTHTQKANYTKQAVEHNNGCKQRKIVWTKPSATVVGARVGKMVIDTLTLSEAIFSLLFEWLWLGRILGSKSSTLCDNSRDRLCNDCWWCGRWLAVAINRCHRRRPPLLVVVSHDSLRMCIRLYHRTLASITSVTLERQRKRDFGGIYTCVCEKSALVAGGDRRRRRCDFRSLLVFCSLSFSLSLSLSCLFVVCVHS